MKTRRFFFLPENVHFSAVKFSLSLNRHVFVMCGEKVSYQHGLVKTKKKQTKKKKNNKKKPQKNKTKKKKKKKKQKKKILSRVMFDISN